MVRRPLRSCAVLFGACLLAAPAFAADEGSSSPSKEDIPDIMIVRVPATGNAETIGDQRTDTDVDVFPLTVNFKRLADGTLDLADIKQQVIDLMQQTQPVTVKINTPDQTLTALPVELQQKFQEAEADSVAARSTDAGDPAEAVVAWRGYGPVRGYSRGVVAFNSNPYRGYRPYYAEHAYYGVNPYFGYYAYGRNFPFTYGVYRYTPSYHYFAYYRHY